MKLDLLYEVQAPKPWPDKPYPYNQREAEQASGVEAIAQTQLAVKLGVGYVGGMGRSITHEQKACGVDPAPSRDSWREAIEAIVAMWEQEKFRWDSPFMRF